MKNKQSPAPMEKRIQELLDKCRGIPPGEVMQLLMRAEHNPALDIEQELGKLFKKYNTTTSKLRGG